MVMLCNVSNKMRLHLARPQAMAVIPLSGEPHYLPRFLFWLSG